MFTKNQWKNKNKSNNFYFKKHFGGEKPVWKTNNKKIILFQYDVKHIFRHSYLARYKLYNLELNR